MANFCGCGRVLKNMVTIQGKNVSYCPVHSTEIIAKPRRDRIGKYSGASKRFKGGYEKDYDSD